MKSTTLELCNSCQAPLSVNWTKCGVCGSKREVMEWELTCDGQECKCWARTESECSCHVDWTPREVYELRRALHDIIKANDNHGLGASMMHPRLTIALNNGRKLLS